MHQMRQRFISLSLASLLSGNLIHSTTSFSLKPNPCKILTKHRNNMSSLSSTSSSVNVDTEYPGTAVERLNKVRARVATLSKEDLSGDWEDVRRKILWAGGLKDLSDAIPGKVSTS